MSWRKRLKMPALSLASLLFLCCHASPGNPHAERSALQNRETQAQCALAGIYCVSRLRLVSTEDRGNEKTKTQTVSTPPPLSPQSLMYSTRGIEAVATITELRSKTSELVEHAKRIKRGILIQKNNEPYAVLINYDLYLDLLAQADKAAKKK